MARNRYGWQKRAKELARKEKNDEKMKRRQGKAISPPLEEMTGAVTEGNWQPEETTPPEGDPSGSFRQGQE